MIVLNFPRTGVESVVDVLQLHKYTTNIKEIKIDNFFSDTLYFCIKELEADLVAGGGHLVAFNYPLFKNQELAKEFLEVALSKKENLYYFPKPNYYVEVDDFAMFSLCENITAENLKVETLYRNNQIHRQLRNKLHTLLRKDLEIEKNIISKKFFYESRKLFNISPKWSEFKVSREQLEFDLIENVDYFYPYPKGINVSINNVCNLTCIMCPFFSKEFEKTHKTDFFKTKKFLEDSCVYEAIEYLSKAVSLYPDVTIGFTAAGEATLDERLPKFIEYAKQKGIPYRYIVTNGTMLEKVGVDLLEAGLNRMAISIDGATSETYKKIRGTSLEKVERGVRKCVEYARKLNALGANIEFDLNCVLTDEFKASNEKEMYLQKWSDCRDIITKIFFTNMVVYDEFGLDKNAPKRYDKFSCSFPWQNFSVDCYGNVTCCCTMDSSCMYEPITLGNVKELGYEEVWKGERYKRLRRETLKQKFSEFSLCNGCVERFKLCFDVEKDTTSRHELN